MDEGLPSPTVTGPNSTREAEPRTLPLVEWQMRPARLPGSVHIERPPAHAPVEMSLAQDAKGRLAPTHGHTKADGVASDMLSPFDERVQPLPDYHMDIDAYDHTHAGKAHNQHHYEARPLRQESDFDESQFLRDPLGRSLQSAPASALLQDLPLCQRESGAARAPYLQGSQKPSSSRQIDGGGFQEHIADTTPGQTSCHVTDFSQCDLLLGALLVMVVVRGICSAIPTSPDLYLSLFGEHGRLVRMTQLPSDEWLLVGYRGNNSMLAAHPAEDASQSVTGRLRTSRQRSPSTSNASESSDYDEGGSNDITTNNGVYMSDRSCRKRRRIPWLASDDKVLLLLKDVKGMTWKQIGSKFPTRSDGALKIRYYLLGKKRARRN
jgi:hypothetical protein